MNTVSIGYAVDDRSILSSVAIGMNSANCHRTPLYHSVINNHVDATCILLESGANPLANDTLRDIINKTCAVALDNCYYVIKNPSASLCLLVEHVRSLEEVHVIHCNRYHIIIVI
jgi:hypothetical protein